MPDSQQFQTGRFLLAESLGGSIMVRKELGRSMRQLVTLYPDWKQRVDRKLIWTLKPQGLLQWCFYFFKVPQPAQTVPRAGELSVQTQEQVWVLHIKQEHFPSTHVKITYRKWSGLFYLEGSAYGYHSYPEAGWLSHFRAGPKKDQCSDQLLFS